MSLLKSRTGGTAPTGPSPCSFTEFIATDETGKPRRELRIKVRSHSSRIGWAGTRAERGGPQRRCKARRSKKPAASITFIGTEQPALPASQVALSTGLDVPKAADTLVDRCLGGGRLDPFQSFPRVRWQPFVPSLVDHCTFTYFPRAAS